MMMSSKGCVFLCESGTTRFVLVPVIMIPMWWKHMKKYFETADPGKRIMLIRIEMSIGMMRDWGLNPTGICRIIVVLQNNSVLQMLLIQHCRCGTISAT